MRRLLALVKYEVKYAFKDKMIVFWLVAWPIFWVLMSGYVFVPPNTGSPVTLQVGVINYDHSNTTLNGSVLVNVLSRIEYNGTRLFHIHNYTDRVKMIMDLKRGRLDAGIIIPDGFGKNATMGVARLEVLVGARNMYTASISEGLIKGVLGEFAGRVGMTRAEIMYNRSIPYIARYSGNNTNITGFLRFLHDYMIGIAHPINVTYSDVKPPGLETRETVLGWVTIGAIGMVALYMGMAYGASILAQEREAGVLHRLIATPLSEAEYLGAHTIAMIADILIASIAIILTGVYAVGARIMFDLCNPLHWLAAGLLPVIALQSFSLGALIAPLSKTSKSAAGVGTSLGLVLAFIAGIWFPEGMLPPSLRVLATYFPVTWSVKAVRSIIVYGRGWQDVAGYVLGSVASLVALYLAAWLVLRWLMRRYLES